MAPVPLPPEVAALLGPAPQERTSGGGCRVWAGNGLVARAGPGELVAREAWVLARAVAGTDLAGALIAARSEAATRVLG